MTAPTPEEYARRSREMIDDIVAMVRDTARETGRAQLSPRTLNAIARVPRHEFTTESDWQAAYLNRPLSIGRGQTISQPYIVALMTDLLDLAPGERVLEVGTGSGYQAAVLAELGVEVYTIEVVEALAREAAPRLARYPNVRTRVGDGSNGWPEAAPFDAIVVAAAPTEVPPKLLDQLKPNGRLVIPLGGSSVQTLYRIVKRADGSIERRSVLQVRFVPFTGAGGKPGASK